MTSETEGYDPILRIYGRGGVNLGCGTRSGTGVYLKDKCDTPIGGMFGVIQRRIV